MNDRLIAPHPGAGYGLPAMIDHGAAERNTAIETDWIDDLRFLRITVAQVKKR